MEVDDASEEELDVERKVEDELEDVVDIVEFEKFGVRLLEELEITTNN